MPVPLDTQITLLARIIQFDRSFEARSDDGLVVGILFRPDLPGSVAVKDRIATMVRDGGILDAVGRKPIVVPVEMSSSLGATLHSTGIDVLYVAPLEGPDLAGLPAETRRLQILTCSGVPGYVSQGLAVGLGLDDGAPRILINTSAARAEGSDFRPGLLKMAQIVREES